MRNILYLFITVSIMFLYSGCKAPSPDGPAQTNLNGIQSEPSEDPPMDTGGGYLLAGSFGIESLGPTSGDLGLTDDGMNLDPVSYVPDTGSETHLNPEPNTILMFVVSILGLFGYRIVRNRK
ncbi:MAG: hypothetical protein B1H08_01775 [Candidatus Omnitrophica bacterium 4484_171]|nr:MAG: hypothetical protein B1H08_01775 [Candidatus Omnitrophica bacterium 4484_171]